MALITAVVALCVLTPAAPAVTLPAGFQDRSISESLVWPTAVAFTPDGRMLVTQKAGLLKIINPGSATATTALNISSRVNNFGDRGLLGLAVDSAFDSNHYVYLSYTYDVNQLSLDSDQPMVSQILRIKLEPDNTVSEQQVILGSYTSGPCPAAANTVDCIPSDDSSHSIGTIRSAPDGSLYIGSGDAASFNYADPLALRVYDEQSLAGKIMHVDRDGNGLAGHPFCPAQTHLGLVCTKLYAKGFRNPFRFSLRPDGTTLVVGDVGWGTKEEIDVIRSGGGNYGWPCYEGTAKPTGYRDMSKCAAEYAKEGTPQQSVAPSYDYDHVPIAGNPSGAIVNGPTYAGSAYPSQYQDAVFFGDYALGFIRYGKLNGSDQVTNVQTFSNNWSGVDIETAPDGNLVWIALDDYTTGAAHIAKAVYTGGSNHQPVAHASAAPSAGGTPLQVAFTGSASVDPDGDTLDYSWAFGDGATSTALNPEHTYGANGTYTATLTVSDGHGGTDAASVQITSGDDPPTPSIDSPAAGLEYAGGDNIALIGSATDPEDGTLPGSKISWDVTLIHAAHAHPITSVTGTASTNFTIRDDHDADSHYVITMTATDSAGLSTHVSRTIYPRTHSLSLRSDPAGVTLGYAGADETAPWTGDVATGFWTTISAPATFTAGSITYQFDHWSDNGSASHEITIPDADSTLTASYRAPSAAPPPPPPPPASTSLMLELNFDDGAGTHAADSSGRGHNGKVSGGASWSAAGKHGGAIKLDGADDTVTVADHDDLDFKRAMTLEAWVKPDTLKAWQTAILKEAPGEPAYALYGTGGGTARANGWIGARGVYSPAKLKAGAWVHLALTYDGSSMRIYVDGVPKATGTGVPDAVSSSGVLRIGGNRLWSGEQFKGLIDDVRLYNRKLSANEIKRDMTSPTASVASTRKRTAPKIARACLSPGNTKHKPKLTAALKRKKVKRCADKPHKARKQASRK